MILIYIDIAAAKVIRT